MTQRCIALILLFPLMVLTPECLVAEGSAPREIKALLLRYAESLDRQDSGVAERTLHADSRQYAVTPNGFLNFDRSQYLDLLEQKKIGGVASRPSVRHIRVAGAAASATLERPIQGHDILFTHYVQLLHIDDAWMVVSVTTGITKAETEE